MRFIPLIACFLACFANAYGASCNIPIKIAIIDTGFGANKASYKAKLCKYGHKDFSVDQRYILDMGTVAPVPLDINKHGTNIAGIIDNAMAKSGRDYCLVILKFYSEKASGIQNLDATIKALKYAINLNVDVVNYSAGGPEESLLEKQAVKNLLDKGIKLVSAAGNEGHELGVLGQARYPAMHDKRAIVVGNINSNGKRDAKSNYGKPVTRFEIGQQVEAFGIILSGTSQATAVATGKIASTLQKRCDR